MALRVPRGSLVAHLPGRAQREPQGYAGLTTKQLNKALLVAARGAREGLWSEQRGHRVQSSLVILLSLHNPAWLALAPRAPWRDATQRAARRRKGYTGLARSSVRKHLVTFEARGLAISYTPVCCLWLSARARAFIT